jgi:hypothetical protein
MLTHVSNAPHFIILSRLTPGDVYSSRTYKRDSAGTYGHDLSHERRGQDEINKNIQSEVFNQIKFCLFGQTFLPDNI